METEHDCNAKELLNIEEEKVIAADEQNERFQAQKSMFDY